MKSIFTILALFVMFNVSAQMNPEKKAKRITAKMTEALSLTEKESNDIYQIQLNRFKEGLAIRKEYQGAERKEKLKGVGKKIYNDLKNYLGKERLKQWRAYRKNNK